MAIVTVRDYLLMGGYAEAVWPAYGVAVLVVVAFAVDSWRRLRRAAARLQRLEAEGSVRTHPHRRRAIVEGPPQNRTDDHAVAKPRNHLEPGRRTSVQGADS